MKFFVASIALNIALVGMFSPAVNADDIPTEGSLLNGDVNCNGSVDMSDAIRILNWLFVGGDGPCPLADTPELVEQIAQLEADLAASTAAIEEAQAEVARLTGELSQTQETLTSTQQELAATEQNLTACIAAKDECAAQLSSCTDDLDNTSAELASTQATLNETQVALDICTDDKLLCEGQRVACNAQLQATESALNACDSAKQECETSLADAEQALVTAEERSAELEVPGCMDPQADNYAPCANIDNGGCEYWGCTDPEAINYDPRANVDDGSCHYINGFTLVGENEQGFSEFEHNQTGIIFVRLPGGTFNMGSPEGECHASPDKGERPVHEVTLSPFLIAKYEVSQVEWEAVMGEWDTNSDGDDLPVEQVSWDDIQVFEERTGLTLPTEAQWEYACRAGTNTSFWFGENITTCQANWNGNYPYCGAITEAYRATTVAVDSFEPNGFGLYNMHGNVLELCEDVYDRSFYSRGEAAGPDPLCTSGSENRVARGGHWKWLARICRSAYRDQAGPSFRQNYYGFRAVYWPLP
ncbi:MAG: SUMF1/EgtB/PvdO family nonheme iron enzyme [Planctomycetota bacterium]|jgi:formylglycine-generating enzyme required for sulfatase activity